MAKFPHGFQQLQVKAEVCVRVCVRATELYGVWVRAPARMCVGSGVARMQKLRSRLLRTESPERFSGLSLA